MDATTRSIAEFAIGFRDHEVTAAARRACVMRVVDALGCALGALDAEPVRLARRMAERARPRHGGARLIGTRVPALPELAAFANGVAVRYLDGNDTYPGGGGHPSDVIAGALAIADERNASGERLLGAVVVAYQIYRALFRASCLRDRGLDHVFYTAVASAAAAARLLGLDTRGCAEAVALAATPNLALEATRRGALSMWKGCAAGNAVRNGVFAALLANDGMTGPERPFDGAHGLADLLGGFTLPALDPGSEGYAVERSNLKYHLSEYHSQAPIAAALELQPRVRSERIERIVVYSYAFTVSEIGSEPEKWHPTTRETADHSLPYILAAVLIDGAFSDRIFEQDRLRDPRIHALSDKVEVREDPEFTRRFPGSVPCRLEIRDCDGTTHIASLEHPRGHVGNPMTEDEVSRKFLALAGRALPDARAEQALRRLWDLDEMDSAGDVLGALVIAPH